MHGRPTVDWSGQGGLGGGAGSRRDAGGDQVTKRGWLLFVAVGVIWGLPYFFIRVAVRDLDPATLVFLRTALASLILLPIVVRRGKWRQVLRKLPLIAVFAAGEMAIPWLLLVTAEQKVTSSFAGLAIAVVPLIGAGLTSVLGFEHLGRRRMVGLLVGLVGVTVLVGVDAHGVSAASLLELLVVGFGYAASPILLSRRLNDVPDLEVITTAVVLTALVYAPFG